jgi:hypothetical protein
LCLFVFVLCASISGLSIWLSLTFIDKLKHILDLPERHFKLFMQVFHLWENLVDSRIQHQT